MTLAAAYRFERPSSGEHAVMLLSDSRFTLGSTHRDNGAKLWRLAAGVYAAFAGDVEIAEKSLALLQRKLREEGEVSFEAVSDLSGDSTRRFARGDRSAHYLVAAALPDGSARLWLLSPDDGLAARECTTQVIGHPDERERFLENWVKIAKHLQGPSGPMQGEDGDLAALATRPFAVFAQTVREGGETVGGLIQCRIVRRGDAVPLHSHVSNDKGATWEREDAALSHMRSIYREPERRGAFRADIGAASF